MSDIYDIGERRKRNSERETEASLWIARLDRHPTDDEIDALLAWIDADPENEAILLRMARLWDRMDVLTHLSDLIPLSTSEKTAS